MQVNLEEFHYFENVSHLLECSNAAHINKRTATLHGM